MAYSSLNAITGGRGVRRTRRARRSYDRSPIIRARRRTPTRVRTPTLKARQSYLVKRRENLLAEIARRSSPRIAFKPTQALRPTTSTRKVPQLERRLERTDTELERVRARLHERRSKQAAKDDISTVEALEIASLGLPGIGLVTGAGKILGTKALSAGVKALAGKGAKEAAETVASTAAKRAKPTPLARGARAAGKGAKGAGKAVTFPVRHPIKTAKADVRAQAPIALATSQGGGDLDHPVLNVASLPYQLGRAAVEDPEGFGSSTVNSLRDTLLGLPNTLYETGAAGVEAVQGDTSRAEKLWEQIKADYEHRYGPLVEGDTAEFRKQVAEESGLTPFALDALIAAPPVSRVLGRTGRSGAMGQKAQALMTEPRPGLRVAADTVREQDVSRGMLGATVQRRLDRRRAAAAEKRRGRFEGGEETALRAVEPEAGEVVPLSARSAAKMQRRSVAGAKGRGYLGLIQEQGVIARGLGRAIRKLDKPQQQALTNALKLGIRDPETGVAVLTERLAQIEKAREGREAPPRSWDETRTIQAIIDNAETIFTPEFARLMDDTRRQEKRGAAADPALASEQALRRRYAQQAQYLGMKPREGELAPQFISRVRTEAKKRGLQDAAYVASELPGRKRFAEFAVGGTRASHIPKPYEGRLFERGTEATNPDVVIRGLMRNVKRRFNWNLVGDTFDEHTFAWGRNKSVRELREEMARRGISEDKVAFWNPKIFRKRQEGTAGIDEGGAGVAEDLMQGADSPLAKAFAKASDPEDFDSAGWSAIPREVYDEMHANVNQGGGLLGRIADIGIQKSSRYVLGANPPWLAFQVASNVALAGLAGAGPGSLVKGQLWWRGLSQAERNAIEPYLGVGHHTADVRQTKLGAAASKSRAKEFIYGWQAIKASKFGRGAAKANPLDALFRFDNAQNNFFRRAVLYNDVKKATYRNMGGRVKALMDDQAKLADLFKLDPQGQMKALLANPKALERHAQHVSDFLGDYTTFTAKERAILKRSVMFYGYLRFSLRFAFYTMPVKHPVMTGLLGNMARLKTQELREMLGEGALPFALGSLYLDNGKMVVELSRANPVMNALTDAIGGNRPGQLIGVLPPYVSMLAGQVTKEDPYTGKEWTVLGENQPRNFLEIDLPERLRIFGEQSLRLFYPYRTAEKLAFQGEAQGADTMLIDPRPVEDPTEGQRKVQRRIERAGAGEILQEELAPFLPHSSEGIVSLSKYLSQKRKEEAADLADRPQASSSSGSGSWYGGSSSSSGSGKSWY